MMSNNGQRHSNRRKNKTQASSRVERGNNQIISDKALLRHAEEDARRCPPLKPMTPRQKRYIDLARDYRVPIVIATGYPGTSKTYIPTSVAAEEYRSKRIEKIIIVRPAVSDSKSLGFYQGDLNEKAANWSMPIVDALVERMGKAAYKIALEAGDIVFVPLEVIKGRSFNNSYILCDEAQDLTVKEVVKCITRLGKNSKLFLMGDIRQCDLKVQSGLARIINMINHHEHLRYSAEHIDFNHIDDIVRSEAVKDWIIAFTQEGIY